ncbi:hypothetical protein IKF28_01080 [Candidatus Saccharibacteria bacterium]|nr:hypothetical protein [Candidatus Saccharibacteria bacterium]
MEKANDEPSIKVDIPVLQDDESIPEDWEDEPVDDNANDMPIPSDDKLDATTAPAEEKKTSRERWEEMNSDNITDEDWNKMGEQDEAESSDVLEEMHGFEEELRESGDNLEAQRKTLAKWGEKINNIIKEIDQKKDLEEKLKNNSLTAREIADNYDFLQSKGFSITPKELLDKYEAEKKEDKSLPPVFE